jgi:ABC-type transport system substrate-binding protein
MGITGHVPPEAAAAVAARLRLAGLSLPRRRAQMRTHPIGTGPSKFVRFKPNECIRLVCNPDYSKPDRPYFDVIEYT